MIPQKGHLILAEASAVLTEIINYFLFMHLRMMIPFPSTVEEVC